MSRTSRLASASMTLATGLGVTPTQVGVRRQVRTQGVEGGWVETTYTEARGLAQAITMRWREDDTQLELASLHVKPEARGQDLGRELLEHVCNVADQGGWSLRLMVSSDLSKTSLSDDELRSWYERHGFMCMNDKHQRDFIRPPR